MHGVVMENSITNLGSIQPNPGNVIEFEDAVQNTRRQVLEMYACDLGALELRAMFVTEVCKGLSRERMKRRVGRVAAQSPLVVIELI